MRSLSFFAGLAAFALASPLSAQSQPAEQPAPAVAAPAAPATPIAAPQLNVTPALTPENTWYLDLSTGGRVTIQLRPDAAPNHVERIRALTRQGFYNGLSFHRVIEGFMAQGGDPTGSGMGGSPLPNVNAEISGLPHVRGAVGMARAQELNSANSQFFIMFTPRLQMDREYTILGRVVGGMNFVDAIERGEPPAAPTRVVRASIGSDNIPPPTIAELTAAATPPAAAAAAAPRAPGAVGPAMPRPVAGPRRLDPVRAPDRRRGQ
ncbi:peptidylprolyl isomerase [Sphingosinicella sp.]|uniref:peptidylprolyl isomerase n=1 Tax=Sphingosinicella sp. TaxID=1917971 RepID=UPI0040377556